MLPKVEITNSGIRIGTGFIPLLTAPALGAVAVLALFQAVAMVAFASTKTNGVTGALVFAARRLLDLRDFCNGSPRMRYEIGAQ